MADVFFGDRFVDETQALLPVTTHALHYGIAVFEGIRAYRTAEGSAIFRPTDHYRRFLKNAALLQMQLPHSAEDLTALTIELLQRNENYGDTYIRPLIYSSSTKVGAHLQPGGEKLAIMTFAWTPTSFPPSVSTATYSKWRRFSHVSCPAGAKIAGLYVNSALAIDESKRRGFDQTIMLSAGGEVAEGYGANIFAVFGDKVMTPPESADILAGITRDTLIRHFQSHKVLSMTVESIAPDQLFDADEIFLCGTGLEIRPIGRLEDRVIGTGGIGPITTEAARWYRAIVTGTIPAPDGWRVRVVPPGPRK